MVYIYSTKSIYVCHSDDDNEGVGDDTADARAADADSPGMCDIMSMVRYKQAIRRGRYRAE